MEAVAGCARVSESTILLHLVRKANFVSAHGPEGVEKASSGSPLASLLLRRWALMHEMGLRLPDCEVSTMYFLSSLLYLCLGEKKGVWLCKEHVK